MYRQIGFGRRIMFVFILLFYYLILVTYINIIDICIPQNLSRQCTSVTGLIQYIYDINLYTSSRIITSSTNSNVRVIQQCMISPPCQLGLRSSTKCLAPNKKIIKYHFKQPKPNLIDIFVVSLFIRSHIIPDSHCFPYPIGTQFQSYFFVIV